jgi:hypothetical protein
LHDLLLRPVVLNSDSQGVTSLEEYTVARVPPSGAKDLELAVLSGENWGASRSGDKPVELKNDCDRSGVNRQFT